MPLMDPHLTLATYTLVLARMYPLLAGWEAFAHKHAPADLAGMVAQRRRAPLLEQDLHALTTRSELPRARFDPAEIPGLPHRESDDEVGRGAFLGAMYVIEGSTLGGQHIARHVEPLLGLSREHGTAYFRGYAEHTSEMWRGFQQELDRLPQEAATGAIAAARAMFGAFERALG